MKTVGIIGGGVSGLATAWYLRQRTAARPVVFESSGRLGGKLRTELVAGVAMDVGADAVRDNDGEFRLLCKQVGLDEQLVKPSTGRAAVWRAGALRTIPSGTELGIPPTASIVREAYREGLLQPAEAARALADRVIPAEAWKGDWSIGDLVRRRMGPAVVDALVGPLLGGVYAGDPDDIGVRAVLPSLAERLDRTGRILGPPDAAADPPDFWGLRGGLEEFAQAMAGALPEVHTDAPVSSISPDARGWAVNVEAGGAFSFDEVVIATGAQPTARLLSALAPRASNELGAFESATVAIVVMAFPTDMITLPSGFSGVLVADDGPAKAFTWSTNKWSHLAESGRTLIRASVGRAGADDAQRSDHDLVRGLREQLGRMVSLTGDPHRTLVTRWPDALPQYEPGHVQRLRRAERDLRGLRGLHVTGSFRDGSGIATCLRHASNVAADIDA